jgi:hypothetical protein
MIEEPDDLAFISQLAELEKVIDNQIKGNPSDDSSDYDSDELGSLRSSTDDDAMAFLDMYGHGIEEIIPGVDINESRIKEYPDRIPALEDTVNLIKTVKNSALTSFNRVIKQVMDKTNDENCY